MADLVTLQFVTNCLVAGGKVLTAAEQTLLPQLITAGSRLARIHCNRYFTQSVFDGEYTVDSPSKVFLLRQFPLIDILRIASDPTPVLGISNSNTALNARAYVKLVTTGDSDILDLPVTVTALRCVRISNGQAIVNEGQGDFTLSSYATVQALANAINALGNGWLANVQSPYGSWPVMDPENAGLCYFRPIQSSLPALGTGQAQLSMHVNDLSVTSRADIAEVNLQQASQDAPFDTMRWGSYLSTDLDDVSDFGGFQGIRCIYLAGQATVPEPVQQAVVETVFDMLNLLSLDQRLGSESDGDYSYSSNAANRLIAHFALTPSAAGKLNYYRSNRA